MREKRETRWDVENIRKVFKGEREKKWTNEGIQGESQAWSEWMNEVNDGMKMITWEFFWSREWESGCNVIDDSSWREKTKN